MHHSVAARSFLVAVVIFCLSEPLYAGTCSCLDIADMKHRQQEIEVALNAYKTEIQNMQTQMMQEMKPLLYTAARRDKLQSRVQEALNQNAAGKLPTGATGNTDNLCNITVNERATACMQESARQHEQVHRDACLKTLSLFKVAKGVATPGKFKDRFERDNALLTTYAVEEIQGYSAEQRFLAKQIPSVEKECQPKPEIQRDYTSTPRSPNPVPDPKPSQKAKDPVNRIRGLFGK